MNKIDNNEPFSFIRFQIEYWRIVRLALKNMGYPDWSLPTNFNSKDMDEDFVLKLGKNMVIAWDTKQSGGRPFKFPDFVFSDHIRMIINPKPDNFYLAVSDRAWHFGQMPPPPYPGWSSWAGPLIKGLLPKDEIPFNSIVWRRWSQNGRIKTFMDKYKNEAIIIIGPYYYKNLANKLGFTNYKYIEISLTEACFELDKTKKQIENAHNELLKNNKKVLHFYAGGSAGAWLIMNLHSVLENAYMIEFGRALDVYFYYDDVKAKEEQWVFGGWMDKHPPKWIKE